MMHMKALRVAFALGLGLVGLVPILELTGHHRATPIHSERELGDRLRRQGKDPRRYLIWKGCPLRVAYPDSIAPEVSPFDIVTLVQAFDIPSEVCVERYSNSNLILYREGSESLR